MSRLARLSARQYQRLTPEQRHAVDVLRYQSPGAASRGEQKTILGWKRTAEETAAYARKLIDNGLMLSAAASRLGVEPDHLRRQLKQVPKVEKPARNRTIHAEKTGPTDKTQVVGRRNDLNAPPVYGSDPFAYDFKAALARARPRS